MKKGDILLICVILCMGIVGMFFLYNRNTDPGGTLTVTVDGEFYADYDLSVDQEVTLEIEGASNRFVIESGSVRMVEADCPDQYCVKHAPIDKMGETIICLPHKVVLEITEGEKADHKIDG